MAFWRNSGRRMTASMRTFGASWSKNGLKNSEAQEAVFRSNSFYFVWLAAGVRDDVRKNVQMYPDVLKMS
jgi:hypothetical protein